MTIFFIFGGFHLACCFKRNRATTLDYFEEKEKNTSKVTSIGKRSCLSLTN